LIYYYTAKYDLAIQQYIEALKLLESIKDTKTLPNIYNGLSGMYKEIRNYDEALNYGQKALKLFSQNKDSVGMASALNNVGNVYDYQNKLDEALDILPQINANERAHKNGERVCPAHSTTLELYYQKKTVCCKPWNIITKH
jgi:tetratricopeptide (TPR) repeat protein